MVFFLVLVCVAVLFGIGSESLAVRLPLELFEALELDGVSGLSAAGQQHAHVSPELGAQAEVDERVVEAGGFGEEPREDAGETGHVETPR